MPRTVTRFSVQGDIPMLYVGIDIGKRSHTVALLDDQGQVRGKPFIILNSHSGMERLRKRVEQANPKQEPVVFGMEATGHYWLPLYCHLKDQGREVFALNPLQTSAYRRRHIRPVKNDKVDVCASLRCYAVSRWCNRRWRTMRS